MSNNASENKSNKQICVGLMAHVDAGKTTLSESLLYICGAIRKQGRVDHGDTFLDTYELERARGITIFSKMANIQLEDMNITLLDTPGHVDFSAETERTLQILDYAILVVSGKDKVQGHTQTLWKLLKRYQIPVFLFVNKMDQEGTNEEEILMDLQKKLDGNCMSFNGSVSNDDFLEGLAMCDEAVLETYLETGKVEETQVSRMIKERKVFPCYFGSALHMTGIESFVTGLEQYMIVPSYPEEFGAKVYKISRDPQGNRLTYLKITGGCLKVKTLLEGQKVNQIRLYSGAKFETVEEATAGMVCAIPGLSDTYPGQGLGIEEHSDTPVLEPVLTYSLQLPSDCDVHTMLGYLKQLEEEEPQLHIAYQQAAQEIQLQLMGEVQTEVLQSLMQERYGVTVGFSAGNIVYRETVEEPVEGIGHYEPLRHYAEVHLLLEPGESGSGMQFSTQCSEDELDRNWQRLILTHLEEKEHLGVLTGSPITDMKITLIAGKAHLKHTEGGDFREAVYRAVRQGLKSAKSILLEPYYSFKIRVPMEHIGRTMTDVQRMCGSFEPPVQEEEYNILTGEAPVATMKEYQKELISYTGGKGTMQCVVKGYLPCHNQEEVVEQIAYDSERDLENPTGSVFCAHGAGFVVPWDQVAEYMHIDTGLFKERAEESKEESEEYDRQTKQSPLHNEKELEAIFERTYGPVKRRSDVGPRRIEATVEKPYKRKFVPQKDKYLLVDGYNIIHAWDDLKSLATDNMAAARDKLMDILSNYQGYMGMHLILVFDAYLVQGGEMTTQTYHNIHVVYTKEAETADQYIEKTAHEIGRKYDVTVATSDGMEQMIILGQGCRRMSARELLEEIKRTNEQIRDYLAERE